MKQFFRIMRVMEPYSQGGKLVRGEEWIAERRTSHGYIIDFSKLKYVYWTKEKSRAKKWNMQGVLKHLEANPGKYDDCLLIEYRYVESEKESIPLKGYIERRRLIGGL